MRMGIKFLALCGLCGFVLSCLMGLAEEGPAPEVSGADFLALPPEQSELAGQKPPEKYSRSKPTPSPVGHEFFPLGAELPPATDSPSEDHLIHAEFEDAGSPPSQPATDFLEEVPNPAPAALAPHETLFQGIRSLFLPETSKRFLKSNTPPQLWKHCRLNRSPALLFPACPIWNRPRSFRSKPPRDRKPPC